jgi:hypothetical protein
MSIDQLILKRFGELNAQFKSLGQSESSGYYDPSPWQQWATSAHHLLRASFGESSPHSAHFASTYEYCKKLHGDVSSVAALKGIFLAAKADYEGGYAFKAEALISGEIYGDFVALSKNALTEGYKDVAAVLACAALEDALKRYASMNQLDVSDKVMQEVVSALKSKGLVGGAQKTLLDAMPKIRDYAMHANWDKITAQDVGSVLGFVEQLLLSKFS